jgi:hypothetical protein
VGAALARPGPAGGEPGPERPKAAPRGRFEATGRFRLAFADRWWLVGPDGRGQLSLGVNHIDPAALTQAHNRDHWASRFGLSDQEAGRPQAFQAGFERKVKADLRAIGFNALGCHSDHRLFSRSWLPYVKTVRFLDVCHYMEPAREAFMDVFSPAFERHCADRAEAEIAPVLGDRFLLGYCFTDCPVLTDLDAAARIANIYGAPRRASTTFPGALRNLAAPAPGKLAYVELMRRRHRSIDHFNAVYSTCFESFGQLAARPAWRGGPDPFNDAETADNLAFLTLAMDRAYGVEVAAVRRRDPDRLIFGDKLNGNTDTPAEIVRLADRHFDAVFYQLYGLEADHRRLIESWSGLVSKPFLLGDSAICVPSRRLPDPYGPHCGSPAEAAEELRAVADHLFARPDFLGWHWCGWMDQAGGEPSGKQHMGFQDAFGQPHPIAGELAKLSARVRRLAPAA